MTMPTCGRVGCTRRSSVIFRAWTEHPVPRCWDHAPQQAAAIELGWLDPPGTPAPPPDPPSRDPLTLQTQTRTLNTTTKQGEQQP